MVGEATVAALTHAAHLRSIHARRHSSHSREEAAVKEALRNLYTSLMVADPEAVSCQLAKLIARVRAGDVRTAADHLALRLYEQYPADVGVLSAYLLNHVTLHPGEALYLGANEPHAYISGECIECMAASDNVVRAGLTPKLKDVGTLTEMLTYVDGATHSVVPRPLDTSRPVAQASRYQTPSEEFVVDRIALPPGGDAALPSAPGISILIVVEGQGELIASHASGHLSGDLLSEACAVCEVDDEFVPHDEQSRAVKAGDTFVYRPGWVIQVSAASDSSVLIFRATQQHD